MGSSVVKSFVLLTIFIISFGMTIIGFPVYIVLTFFGLVIVLACVVLFARRGPLDILLLWFMISLIPPIIWQFGIPILQKVSLDRTIFLLFLFIAVVASLMRTIKFKSLIFLEKVLFVFVAYSLLNLCFYAGPMDEKFSKIASSLAYGYGIPALVFFFSRNLISDQNRLNQVLVFFCCIGVYLGVTAFFEQFGPKILVFPSYINNSELGIHYGRSRGPFLNSAVNGTVLGLTAVVGVFLLLRAKSGLQKVLLVFAVWIMLAGVFLSQTRSCWIAIAVAFIYLYVHLPRVRIYILLGAFLLLMIGTSWLFLAHDLRQTLFERAQEQTGYSRLYLLVASWRMFLDRPLFGFGFGSFANVSLNYFVRIPGVPLEGKGLIPHNVFAGILAELGLVGIVLLILIYILVYRGGICVYKQWRKEGDILIFHRAMCLIFFVNAMFFEMSSYVFTNAMLMCIAGVTTRYYQNIKDSLSFPMERG